jgi:hypothetical protein
MNPEMHLREVDTVFTRVFGEPGPPPPPGRLPQAEREDWPAAPEYSDSPPLAGGVRGNPGAAKAAQS